MVASHFYMGDDDGGHLRRRQRFPGWVKHSPEDFAGELLHDIPDGQFGGWRQQGLPNGYSQETDTCKEYFGDDRFMELHFASGFT